jgi:N-formylglutamate amidohydrolase
MSGDGAARQTPWFDRLGPAFAATPLVLSVPHAGRLYPDELLADSAVPHAQLEELEDRHADLLISQAVAQGAVAIVARCARAWIDLNRAEEDLDPALRTPPGSGPPATARARSGLGLLPSRLGRRDLWRRGPSAAAATERLRDVHRPYHTAITRALDDALIRHGYAVLLDCHSMPPLPGARPARIVIGDRHGRTAAAGLAARLAAVARAEGYTAAVNAPYAGAHGIERHGQPTDGVHALQIEVDRSLYLMRDMRTLSPGAEPIRALIATLARTALDGARNALSIAAE